MSVLKVVITLEHHSCFFSKITEMTHVPQIGSAIFPNGEWTSDVFIVTGVAYWERDTGWIVAVDAEVKSDASSDDTDELIKTAEEFGYKRCEGPDLFEW